ncbi:pentatricopeptide repeat-containing protein At2g38420, mitochondrial-like [Zingiber officinale]|uniref:pentatricopeptide repeat-containing protein At2g38420, mitochondrial-like n=1 Tax=Zingiber officinale TaxID=94328 RepID=UPI001C4B0C9C|nr:pentatricopeptide repeat-containing protein At2g38420, mitochondrial-like [Zingiber officinale]XP_042385020.1 pentatricopeptide repeat-containing protein At2g38420, mitochondrial-like [Zingiber officinale]
MIMSSSCARNICMRSCRWFASSRNGKRQRSLSEQLAMDTLKKKIAEEPNDGTNHISILTNCFRSYDTDPSPSAYAFVIRHLFRNRMLAHVSSVLEHLEKDERFDVPEGMFVTVIQNFGQTGRLQDAVDLFFRIPKFRSTPSVVSLNALLAVLCESKEGLAMVGDVLSKAPEMNIRFEATTFSILIEALCRNGKLSFAMELLEMMQLHECDPDAGLYSIVFVSLCKQGGSAQVIEFLEKIRNAGFDPGALEYSHVISLLIDEGKADDAHSFLVMMRMEGKRPDIMIYNRILDAFILANDYKKVDELFDEMLLIGLVPCSTTYNTYIHGLCKQGNLEKARRMLICMEKAGCKPDVETFSAVIDGYAKTGEMAKAKELMQEVREKMPIIDTTFF